MNQKKKGSDAVAKIFFLGSILILVASVLWAGPRAETPSSGSAAGRLFPQERTLTVLIGDHPLQPVKDFALAQQAIFEKTNIRLKYENLSGTSGTERANILFATNQIPEIVMAGPIKQNAASGIFLPLSSYVSSSMPNFKRYWDSIPNIRKDSIEGELFYFHQMQWDEIAFSFGPVIRTDLLAKHNLPVPKSFDQLLDVLEALKKIYPDSRPWSTRNGTRQLLTTTAYMLGSGFGTPEYEGDSVVYYDREKNGGTYICGPATPEFKTVLKFFADAYRRGVLNPDYATDTADTFRARLNSGQSFFYNDNSSFAVDYTNVLRQTIPDASLEFIPFMTNSYGQRRAISYTDDLRPVIFAMRKDIKNPDQVIQFIDWMYSDEGRAITNYGKEGVSFRYNAQHVPEFIPEYIDRFRNQPSVYYAAFSDAGITCNNFSPIGGNTKQVIEINKMVGNWEGANANYWNLVQEEHKPGNALVSPWAPPPFTKAQLDRVTELKLALSTYLDQEYDKYILGREPIDNWDRVIEQAVRLGARELEDIYNRANAAYK